MRAMERGALARIEELTRIPADVQDALITILSEKTLPVPELGHEVQAARGFNVIATANDRDKGSTSCPRALRRRFNTVVLPLPATCGGRGRDRRPPGRRARPSSLELPAVPTARGGDPPGRDGVPRAAVRASPRTAAPSSSRRPGTLSTAEAISVVTSGLALRRPLRRRRAAAGRRGRRHRRRGGQGPGRGPGRLDASTSRWSCATGTAGRVLRPAATFVTALSCEVQLTACHRDGRPVLSASATTDPVRPARWCAALAEYQPDVVLIEGPPEADPLLALGRRPTAWAAAWPCSAYAVDDRRRRRFWPFAVFSPEWQAMRWALRARVSRCGFCDLPAAACWPAWPRGQPPR